MSASHLGEVRALFNLMTTSTILPDGPRGWIVSTFGSSSFYAFHCDDVKPPVGRKNPSSHAVGFDCVTSLPYYLWPFLLIK